MVLSTGVTHVLLYLIAVKTRKITTKSMLHTKVKADIPVATGDAISVTILPTTCVAVAKSSMRKKIHAMVTKTKTSKVAGNLNRRGVSYPLRCRPQAYSMR